MNIAIIAGTIGRDAETRYTQSGKAFATFSVATNKRVKRGEEWTDETQWHRVMLWGREGLHQHLTKGTNVAINGEIEYRKYTDKDGVEKTTTSIVIGFGCDIQLMGGGQKGTRPAPKPRHEETPQDESWSSPKDTYDDDIPF